MRLIDADLVIDTVNEFKGKNRITDLGIKLVEEIVSNAPTVDAEPIRHGHWIVIGKRTDCEYVLIFKCSCCHTPFIGMVDRYHYCPNCGAKIDEIEEGEVVVTKKGMTTKMDEVEEER